MSSLPGVLHHVVANVRVRAHLPAALALSRVPSEVVSAILFLGISRLLGVKERLS